MADINDVYAWMTTDGAQVNLAMTVSPADPGTREFGPTVQYVMHVTAHPAFGMAGTESKVICTFTDNTHGQCWVTDPTNKVVDYVSGDFSGPNGRISASNKFRVFAGQRSDPFFFNLSGFRTAVAAVKQAPPPFTQPDGCPDSNGPTANALRGFLTGTPNSTTTDNGPCPVGVKDCFADFNVMAIVVQVDKDEVSSDTNKIISVWASTYATP
jgi:hypothetical protein